MLKPPPCNKCHLMPCGRRTECPRWRRWYREHQADLAEINAAKEKDKRYFSYLADAIRRMRNG